MRATRVRALASLLALSALVALPAATLGHATLVSGDPAPGSTVETAPSRVSATFDDELDGAKSSIVLVGPDGQTVGTGSLAPEDSHVLAVIVPPLGPGTYEVRWTAATADGHIERGTYRFTVATPPSLPAARSSPRRRHRARRLPRAPNPRARRSRAPSPRRLRSPTAATAAAPRVRPVIVAAAVAGLVLGVVIGWWRRRQGR